VLCFGYVATFRYLRHTLECGALGVRQNGSHKRFQEGPSNDGATPSAEALGVRKREDTLKQNSTDPSNEGTVPSAEALVQPRGGDRKSEINVTNVTMAPSQAEDHADEIGVTGCKGKRNSLPKLLLPWLI